MSNRKTVSRSTILGAGLRDISTAGAKNGRAIQSSFNPSTGNQIFDAIKAVGDLLSGGKSKVGWSSSSQGRKSNTGKGVTGSTIETLSNSSAFSFVKGVELGYAYSATNKALAQFGKNQAPMTVMEKSLYSSAYDQAASKGFSGSSVEQATSDTMQAISDQMNDVGDVGTLGQHSSTDYDSTVTDGTGLVSDAELEEQNMNTVGAASKHHPSVFDQAQNTTKSAKSFNLQSYIDNLIGFKKNSLLDTPRSLPASLQKQNRPVPHVDLLSATKQRQVNSMYGPRRGNTIGNQGNVQSANKSKSFDARSFVDGYLGHSLNDYINAVSPSPYSSSFDRSVQNRKNKEEKKQAAKTQQHLDNYSKSQAAAHQKSQEAHNAAAKAAKSDTTSAAKPTNPDFDAKHGLTSTAQNQSSDAFTGHRDSPSAITGALGKVDEKTGVLGNAKAPAVRAPSAAPNVVGKNAQQGNVKGGKGSSLEQGRGDGAQNSNVDARGYNKDTGYRDDNPSTPKNEAGFKDLGSWAKAVGETLETGWYGSPNANPHTKGASGGSTGGKEAICTELHRQGLIRSDIFYCDIAHAKRTISARTRNGYHFWAVPYVRLMRKSKVATMFIRPFAQARAEQVAFEEGLLNSGNWVGKIVRLLGEPICSFIGCFCGATDWRTLYDPDRTLTMVQE